MTEPTLFDAPAVGVDTSQQAAAKIAPRVPVLRAQIYLYLKAMGTWGATAGELATVLTMNPSTVRPRLRELEGTAKWAPDAPRLIRRLTQRRAGMRVYQAL
jgi:hypothetical protein